jgi:hypothetical protein
MYTRHRRWKRKTKRRSWLPVVLLLIGVPVGLELLTRAVTHAAGIDEQLTTDLSTGTEQVEAYRLQFLGSDQQPYEGLSTNGELLAARNPLMGYQLLPDQTNSFWTINEQGFRDDEPVSPQKAEGEVRIFVLGGSAAFGQLNSGNQATLASHLEKLLDDRVADQRANSNRYQPATLPYRADQVGEALALPPRIPDRQYRVINAAVPGYASGNELAMLMQRVSNYNPDILIVLNSYQDLLLPGDQVATDIPGLDALVRGERESTLQQVQTSVGDWFNGLYTVRAVDRFILQANAAEDESAILLNLMVPTETTALEQHLPTDDAELERRVARYRDNLLQMVRWSSSTQRRLLIGLQPEITGRSTEVMTPEESAILAKLGSNYSDRIQTGYTNVSAAAEQAAAASANARLVNLQTLYENFEGQAFQSPTSLTDEANRVMAGRFFEAIVGELAIQPRPFGSAE